MSRLASYRLSSKKGVSMETMESATVLLATGPAGDHATLDSKRACAWRQTRQESEEVPARRPGKLEAPRKAKIAWTAQERPE